MRSEFRNITVESAGKTLFPKLLGYYTYLARRLLCSDGVGNVKIRKRKMMMTRATVMMLITSIDMTTIIMMTTTSAVISFANVGNEFNSFQRILIPM